VGTCQTFINNYEKYNKSIQTIVGTSMHNSSPGKNKFKRKISKKTNKKPKRLCLNNQEISKVVN
jgi:hypothetical protein